MAIRQYALPAPGTPVPGAGINRGIAAAAARTARRLYGIVKRISCLLPAVAPGLGLGAIFIALLIPLPAAGQGASALGYSGLMLVPVADIAPDGQVSAGVSRIPMLYATDWWPNRRTVFWGRIGFLPFLEAGGMFVRPDDYTWGFGDRSVYIKVQLLKEKGRRPALAIGTQDFFAIKQLKWETATVQHFGALYLVASRHDTLRGVPLHFHLGYGPDWLVARTKMLVGLFGGVTWTPHRYVTLLAEYDAERFNAGFRFHPLPLLQAQLAWWKMRELTATLAFHVDLM